MRLAFIDYVFSWPPLGGAPADLFYTMRGLQKLGHEVHLFFAAHNKAWDPFEVKTDKLGFGTTRIDFTPESFEPEQVSGAFRRAVDAWQPDIIFQCFGFFMKPWLTKAFEGYPQISRYYAYEPFCPRDYRLYRNSATCPNNYLRTPKECLKCTMASLWRSIRLGHPMPYAREFEVTRAYSPAFHDLYLETLGMYKAIIVYNHFTKRMLDPLNAHVHVIGGGVHLEDFSNAPLPERRSGDKKVILLSGRADDYSKGMHTLKAAGAILAAEREDFEIRVTSGNEKLETAWFKPVGWHSHEVIMQYYRDADICVVPSEWEEPFGLVAVEAMATGRPVVVSDVGGLQEIVIPGETGYIFRRGEAQELANCLRKLLDDPALMARMGAAGRQRVEREYDWDSVIAQHYPAILEEVVR